jgi:cytosine/adenosine deaminase-related metal-dependent hydrolase
VDIIIRSARILTMDEDDTEYEQADILIEDGKIEAIGPDAADGVDTSGARIVEGRNCLAMPGLVNGHFHSPMNLLKGALDDAPLEIYMLFEVPPLADKAASGRFAYIRTMLGVVDMLKQGVTAVHDDAFFVPIATREEVDSVMQAYADGGMRANVAVNQTNVVEYCKHPFLEELLPAALRERMTNAPRLSTAELVDIQENFVDRWHDTNGGRLRASLSCSAPQRVTPDYLTALSDLSRRYDIPHNMHILETKLQRVLGEEKLGKSLIRYVHDQGVLDERALVIHSIWVDDDDIALMADSGCSIAHNPISNLKIGSGVMPFRQLRDAGVNICIGIDEVPVDDGMNLWVVGKMVGLIHKIAEPEYLNWPTAAEILAALTRGGARAMGLERRIGILAPGYDADLILLDLDSLAFTPLNDLRRQLVFCETGSSVTMTIVAGRIVVEDGRLLTVDEEAIKKEARSFSNEIRDYVDACAREASELMPYYRKMYLKGAARDVGMQRWAGPMCP